MVNDDGRPRAAYFTVQNYFIAFNVYGVTYNSLGEAVSGAKVHITGTEYATVSDGTYQIFVPRNYTEVTIQAEGYAPVLVRMPSSATTTLVKQDVYLAPLSPDWWYRTRTYLYTKL